MKNTLSRIEEIDKRFNKKWGWYLQGLITERATDYSSEIKSFYHHQILALLEEIKGEMPKERSSQWLNKERGLHQTVLLEKRAENKGYNSALDDIKAILNKKIEEVEEV